MGYNVEEIKVSVIVPVYRVEEYLDECVESIVNQTHYNLEIILVDDGSPDRCGAMCDEWATKDSRIYVIHKENGGLSSARNAGIEIASGAYFAFIDSDDVVACHMIELLLTNAKKYDAELVCSEFIFSSENDTLSEIGDSYDILNLPGREMAEYFYFRLEDPVKGVPWNKLYSRRLFDEMGIRFPVGKMYEDSEVIPKVTYLSKRVVCINARLYCYRSRTGSIMRSGFTKKKCQDSIDAVYSVVDFFYKKNEGKLLKGSYMYACRTAMFCYVNTRTMNNCKEREVCRKHIMSMFKKYKDLCDTKIRVPAVRKIIFELFVICPCSISRIYELLVTCKTIICKWYTALNSNLRYRS